MKEQTSEDAGDQQREQDIGGEESLVGVQVEDSVQDLLQVDEGMDGDNIEGTIDVEDVIESTGPSGNSVSSSLRNRRRSSAASTALEDAKQVAMQESSLAQVPTQQPGAFSVDGDGMESKAAPPSSASPASPSAAAETIDTETSKVKSSTSSDTSQQQQQQHQQQLEQSDQSRPGAFAVDGSQSTSRSIGNPSVARASAAAAATLNSVAATPKNDEDVTPSSNAASAAAAAPDYVPFAASQPISSNNSNPTTAMSKTEIYLNRPSTQSNTVSENNTTAMTGGDQETDVTNEESQNLIRSTPAVEEGNRGEHETDVEEGVIQNASVSVHPSQQEQHPLNVEGYSSGSVPMVQAELVAPPITAFQVTIDEEEPASSLPANSGGNSRNPNGTMHPLELQESSGDDGDNTMENKQTSRRKIFFCAIGLCVLVFIIIMIVVVATPVMLMDENISGDQPTGPAGPPTSDETYDFDCYRSTLDILLAQRDMPDVNTFVICPNTRIKIGTFANPAQDNYTFVQGDYPLWVIRPNIEILCGLDGNPRNNCTLDGGFVQVLAQTKLPLGQEDILIEERIDNMLVRGITFTGQFQSTGPFSGNSITMSHSGENIRFEDCIWRDITAQYGLINVAQNYFQILAQDISGAEPLEDYSVDVTFSNCEFVDIIYDIPLFVAIRQNLTIENSLFENIDLSFLIQNNCPIERWDFNEGCAGLLYCSETKLCEVNNICVDNMLYHGSALMVMTDSSEWNASNVHVTNVNHKEPEDGEDDEFCLVATAYKAGKETIVECWEDESIFIMNSWNQTASLMNNTIENDVSNQTTCPVSLEHR